MKKNNWLTYVLVALLAVAVIVAGSAISKNGDTRKHCKRNF